MQKFIRTPAPSWWKEKSKEWGEQWEQKHQNNERFIWRRVNGKGVDEIKSDLVAMTHDHCAFCGSFPLGSAIHASIEHFLPKKNFPTHAYEWENLYPCCAICQGAKGGGYDSKLLRPDAPDYDFDRYFDINWNTGCLEPNHSASVSDQERATVTINTFQLNNYARPDARLSSFKEFEQLYYQDKDTNISTFSYPFMLERGVLRTNTVFSEMRITGLKVKNIKCFADLEIPINANENSTLIVGSNSRGKTTLLQLIALGLTGLNQVPLENCWQSVVRKSAEVGEFEITLLQADGPVTLKYQIDADDSISCIQGKETLQKLKDRIILGYGVNRAIPNNQARSNNKFAPVATLFGENAHIKNIQQSETFQYLNSHFEAIKALTNEVFVASNLPEAVRLDSFDASSFYFNTYSGNEMPLGALSEGFKATFVWLFDLMIRLVAAGGNIYKRKEMAGIVLIDEIDLHLHPLWQRTILPSLESVFPKLQLIVTTHSMLVSQSVSGQCLIKLKSDGQGGVEVDKEVEAITSAMSFSEIGREIFDITTAYNQKTEILLSEFYQLRDKILAKETVDIGAFTALFQRIAAKGPELAELIHQELMLLELETHQRFVP